MGAEPRRPAVHQVLATLSYGDAISTHALGIRRVLRAAGYPSDIFVETFDPRLEHFTRDYRDLPSGGSTDDVLIHHFSIHSRASRVAFALPNRMVLVYHNVTQPEFFLGVNDRFAELCYQGRRELAAYPSRVQLALGVSEFNRQELAAAGFEPTGVLSVVPDFSHLEVAPNRLVARGFDDDHVNVLFVGRVTANKKFEDVIRFFHAYQRRKPRSRLLLVGSYAGQEGYLSMLHEFAARHRVANVHFTGQVSNEELAAYYEIADAFLCASEHEGFCVPLVEAFHQGVPVVAYAAAAVPATMDGAGVLYDRKDPELVAALIDAVAEDGEFREQVLAAQDAALERFARRDFAGCLLSFVEQVLAAPPPALPRVTADFWRQVEDAERLEELRAYRPSAFRALPRRPGR